jgi:oligopeptide/dipeptide ABC transporter ATP-binding protein
MFSTPQHPYTQALLSAIPVPDPEQRRQRVILKGDVPSPVRPPSGCRFNPRCQLRAALGGPTQCVDEEPALIDLLPVPGAHLVACHFRGPDAIDAMTGAMVVGTRRCRPPTRLPVRGPAHPPPGVAAGRPA